jgi:hypothetical protein
MGFLSLREQGLHVSRRHWALQSSRHHPPREMLKSMHARRARPTRLSQGSMYQAYQDQERPPFENVCEPDSAQIDLQSAAVEDCSRSSGVFLDSTQA